MILPDISVAEFLGRRMRCSREGEKQKADTAEKEADSPAEVVPSKKVGKKEKKSKKRGVFPGREEQRSRTTSNSSGNYRARDETRNSSA